MPCRQANEEGDRRRRVNRGERGTYARRAVAVVEQAAGRTRAEAHSGAGPAAGGKELAVERGRLRVTRGEAIAGDWREGGRRIGCQKGEKPRTGGTEIGCGGWVAGRRCRETARAKNSRTRARERRWAIGGGGGIDLASSPALPLPRGTGTAQEERERERGAGKATHSANFRGR